MRQCEKYEALLAHYAREELRPKQTERVATHVAQCVRCREEVAAYRRLAAHLNKLPEPILPEHALHGFAEAVMQQVGSSLRKASSSVLSSLRRFCNRVGVMLGAQRQ